MTRLAYHTRPPAAFVLSEIARVVTVDSGRKRRTSSSALLSFVLLRVA
jgi:hypothetical protein